MRYKITRIRTSSGDDKLDPSNRIGRVMDINPNLIAIGQCFYMDCVIPGMMKSLITSPVVEWKYTVDGLRITTQNSIYDLEETNE